MKTRLIKFSGFLKELRNYNRKLFLCLPHILAKTQLAFLTTIFHDIFTL